MKLLQFIFSFLFIRNWYNGEMELSRPRVVLFAGMLGFLIVGIGIAVLMQTPVTYTA